MHDASEAAIYWLRFSIPKPHHPILHDRQCGWPIDFLIPHGVYSRRSLNPTTQINLEIAGMVMVAIPLGSLSREFHRESTAPRPCAFAALKTTIHPNKFRHRGNGCGRNSLGYVSVGSCKENQAESTAVTSLCFYSFEANCSQLFLQRDTPRCREDKWATQFMRICQIPKSML